MGSSQVFAGHIQNSIHAHCFLESQEYVRTFQNLLWIFHSPGIPFKHLVPFVVNPDYDHCFELKKVKLCEADFSGNKRGQNMAVIWEGALQELQPLLSSPMSARLLAFTMIAGSLAFKTPTELGKTNGTRTR